MPVRKPAANQFLFHGVVYPGADTKDWIAHCLELDLVSQGKSPTDAVRMLMEALTLAAEDNLAAGRPPWEFRPAPADVWALWAKSQVASRSLRKRARPVRVPKAGLGVPGLRPEIIAWKVGHHEAKACRHG